MKRTRYIMLLCIRIFQKLFPPYGGRSSAELNLRVPPVDPAQSSSIGVGHKKSIRLWRAFLSLVAAPVYHIFLVVHKRFPRKFAPFPGRPVWI
ncbi:hypothetical protein [Sphingobacterium pedocola]|uniref:hypothetical protein n=1 Tax=Sphingobacterium pedocola TaxID=2082722 RepID=UPI0018C99D3C|nr:hypothetical protein [Sphingobacterium pedocola]